MAGKEFSDILPLKPIWSEVYTGTCIILKYATEYSNNTVKFF